MSDNGLFLKEIEFKDNFGSFKAGTKVYFNDGMREILEFYFKKKWENKKKAEYVAKRMKINVIVGENGTGKTRLLKYIRDKYQNDYEILIDSIDCLSLLKDYSITNMCKDGYKWNYIRAMLYKFGKDYEELFKNFFNISNLELKLELKINYAFYNYYGEQIRELFKDSSSESIKDFLEKELWISVEQLEKIFYDFIDNKEIYIYPFKMFNDFQKKEFLKFYFPLFLLVGLYKWYNVSEEVKDSHIYDIKNNKDINSFLRLRGISAFLRWIEYLEKLLDRIEDLFKVSKFSNVLLKNLREGIQIIKDIKNKNVNKYSYNLLQKYIGLLHWYENPHEDGKGLIYLLFTKFGENIKNGNIISHIFYFSDAYTNMDEKLFVNKFPNLAKFDYLLKDKIKEREISVYGNELFINKLFINDNIVFNNLSAGEKYSLVRFSMIYNKIIKRFEEIDGKNDFIILIDEPDLHLHLDWQGQYIKKLIDVFSIQTNRNEKENLNIYFIIATHSPFILSDVPAENVILLQKCKDEEGKYYTKVTDWWGNEFNDFKTFKEYQKYIEEQKSKAGTFGANFVDLIRNGFFFQTKNLMGSFAEDVIDTVAEKRRQEITNGEQVNDAELKKLENKIGDSFLRDNLLYFKKSQQDAEDKNCE